MEFIPIPNRSNFRLASSSPPSRRDRSGGVGIGLTPLKGLSNGVRLEARIEFRGGFRYAFHAEAKGANLSGITNPVQGAANPDNVLHVERETVQQASRSGGQTQGPLAEGWLSAQLAKSQS